MLIVSIRYEIKQNHIKWSVCDIDGSPNICYCRSCFAGASTSGRSHYAAANKNAPKSTN